MRVKAIFFDGEYFMLPEGCESASELTGRYSGKPVVLPWLREIKCMAPYFVLDNISHKTLTFSSDSPVFDCEAELLTLEEYNSRLREIIPGRCAGCAGYTQIDDGDDSLNGHHDEITLDGVCFLKEEHNDEEHDFPPVDVFVSNAVKEFPGLGLKKLIDAGETEKAEAALSEMLRNETAVPGYPLWLYKTEEGKYRAVMTTMAHDGDGVIVEYVMKKLAEAYGEDWEFFNYIPRGFYPPCAREPERIYRTPEDPDGRTAPFGVAFTTAGDGGFPEFCYVCGLCGEKELKSAARFLQIYGNTDEEMTETDEEGLLTAVTELYERIPPEERLFPPPVTNVYVPPEAFEEPDGYSDEEEIVNDHGMLFSSRSVELCENVALPVISGFKPENFRESDEWKLCIAADLNIPVCQLTLDIGGLPDGTVADHPDLLDAVQRDVNCIGGAVKKNGSALPFLQCFDLRMKKLQIWYVIMRYSRFMYTLRRLDPVFREYPGALRIFTASGKSGGEYVPGARMLKVRTEEQMISDLKDSEEE